MDQTPHRWLLLLHQIPPSPPYFRAKVLRRLNQLGALAIKNSVYCLPETDENMEDLQWVRSEIAQEGGEAWVFRSEAVAGLSDQEMVASFRRIRSEDYKQLIDEAREILRGDPSKHEAERRKLQRRFEEVRRIDFFGATEQKEMEELMESIQAAVEAAGRQPAAQPDWKELRGRTWVTRRGVKVDRIATAWLIRRFIDPGATVRFVDPDHYTHAAGEIRFDMFEGEFTHSGDLCTFEAVLRHARLQDPALDAVAEIVHDIDLKDEKYQRPEAQGIAALIAGIAALHGADDERRIEDGSRIFEALWRGAKPGA